MEKQQNTIKLNLFITDLTEYNAGNLVGKWFDALTEFDAMSAYIDDIVGKRHEWFISDSESDLFEVSEFHSIDELEEMAEIIKEGGFDPSIANLIKNYTDDRTEIISIIEEKNIIVLDGFPSEQEALGEYVFDLINEYEPDNFLYQYFDFEKFGRDLLLTDYSYLGRNEDYDHVYILKNY
ncbi:antirestriction protein ArdA [Staphylococcus pseudintermedius]|uniref:antirestriction protein ArdA n=1 Tax=Staphylococcus pseudintermedius TaxID=283734 RepID=UPI002B258D9E|nr:antirestriction protein ArdA [Staphylococcus pseudintermedius]WQM17813.1 antirestriction protein ArdA [Staphylococcus pseudintermedius]